MKMMKKLAITIILTCFCLAGKAQYNNSLIIEPLLKTDTTSTGQKIHYPQFQNDEVTMSKITIPPGKSTGWHKHEFPVFAYVLKGALTVEVEGGKSFGFKENSTISEVINVFHNGTNNGTEDVVLIAFFMGEKGKALSVHKETDKK